MIVNLNNVSNVRTALFVRIAVDQYRISGSGSYSNQILRFSDHNANFTIAGENYIPLGRLLGVTQSTSELRATGNAVTISLSGIGSNSIPEIINSKIKGSEVKIYRVYFQENGTQIGNTQQRFFGSVNNYSLDETYEFFDLSASNTIQIDCICNVTLLQNKITGRKSSPESMKKFFTSDTSFDRVPGLIGSQFDFGARR
jgi:hypothetical protein